MRLPFGKPYGSADRGFGYWEPEGQPAEEPLVDDLTRSAAVFLDRSRSPALRYRGVHFTHKRRSTNEDRYVEVDGQRWETNSLLVYYLAYHRDDLPRTDLSAVAGLFRRAGIDPAECSPSVLAEHVNAGLPRREKPWRPRGENK